MKISFLFLSLVLVSGCASSGTSHAATKVNQVMNIKKRQPIKVGDNYLELVSFSHKTEVEGGPKKATALLMYSSSPTKQIELSETIDAQGKATFTSSEVGKYKVQLLKMKYDESVQVDLIPK